MAIGDQAASAGYSLVPDTGTDDAALVKMGAREINRTRDYVAGVKQSIPEILPVANGGTGSSAKAGARTNLGITSGTGSPPGTGVAGDIYFKILG